MMRLIVCALALLLALPASAQTILSGFVSRHSSPGYHEANHGIGVRIDTGALAGWSAGTYRNSLDRQTVYVAREWLHQVAGPLHVGVVAGLATGYRWAVVPAVLPEVVLRLDRLELAVVVQPFDLRQSPAFVAAQIRYRIGE